MGAKKGNKAASKTKRQAGRKEGRGGALIWTVAIFLMLVFFIWYLTCTQNLVATLLPSWVHGTSWPERWGQIVTLVPSCIIAFRYSIPDLKGLRKPAIVSAWLILVVLLVITPFKLNVLGKGHESVEVTGRVAYLDEQHHTMFSRYNTHTEYYWVAAIDFEQPRAGRVLIKLENPFPYLEGDKVRVKLNKGSLGMYYADGYYDSTFQPERFYALEKR